MIRLNLIEDETVPLNEIKLFSKKTQKEITDDFK
jgi:hypothetical protein